MSKVFRYTLDTEMDYDGNGNQVKENGTTRKYLSTYINGQKTNRLAYFEGSEGTLTSSPPQAYYSYTMDGRRVGKEVGRYVSQPGGGEYLETETTLYLYDGKNVINEIRSDAPNVTYTYPQKCSGCGSGCGSSTSVFTVYRNSEEFLQLSKVNY